MDNVYRVVDKVIRKRKITKKEQELLQTTAKQLTSIASIAEVSE
jgi:hypothetical protein